MTWAYWYTVGALLMSIFVVGSRRPELKVHLATEIFLIATWPIMLVILILGAFVLVVRVIWKGDYPDE